MVNPMASLARREGPVPATWSDRSRLLAIRTAVERVGRARLLIGFDLAAIVVIAAAFGQVGPPELLFHVAFVILVAEAFVYGRRICLQRIAAVSVALIAYAALSVAGVPVAPLELSEWPLMFTIAILVAWMADHDQTAGRRYAALYRETRERLVRAQEEERRRISRDLHDGIAQNLTALAFTLDSTEGQDAGAAGPAIERSRALAREALADTRLAAERLRPPRLVESGLTGALRSMASVSGGRITVDIEPSAEVRLAEDVELNAFRIAEGAVRNAVRHAAASRITVTLRRAGERLDLRVVDDGIGFARGHVDAHRLGLVGMAERADSLHGRLDVQSVTGQGTQVWLSLPIVPAGATS